MRFTRFLVVLVAAVFTGNHIILYATAGSVFKFGVQTRDDVSSALNKAGVGCVYKAIEVYYLNPHSTIMSMTTFLSVDCHNLRF